MLDLHILNKSAVDEAFDEIELFCDPFAFRFGHTCDHSLVVCGVGGDGDLPRQKRLCECDTALHMRARGDHDHAVDLLKARQNRCFIQIIEDKRLFLF